MDSFVPGGILVDRNRNARGRESIAMRKHPNEREYWDCVSELLADGAVQAALFVDSAQPGFYTMTDMLRGKMQCL